MILVRNHQLLLNGSKAIVFLAVMLVIQSCGIFNKELPTVEKQTKEKHPSAQDSAQMIVEEIVIEQQQEEQFDRDDHQPNTRKIAKNDYRIAVVLPFEASASIVDEAHFLVMSFYQGLKSGLYRADLKGARVTVDVYDSKATGYNYHGLRQELKQKNTDLILGGLMKQSIQMLSQISKQDSIPFVCPLYPTNTIVKNNPYHIQVNPGLDAHLHRIKDQILKKHPDANIFVVGRSTAAEKNRIEQILDYFTKSKIDTTITKVRKIVIDWEDENSDFSFSNHLKDYRKHVFLIPSWSSETFVYHVLRQLSIDKNQAEILVFGMPQWKGFELVSPEYLESLQVHISAGSFIDDKSTARNMKKRLFEMYNKVPTQKDVLAYAVGVDVGQYFTELLIKRSSIQKSIQEYSFYGEAVHFTFPGSEGQEALPKDLLAKPQRLENYGVKMLKFSDWQYKVMK